MKSLKKSIAILLIAIMASMSFGCYGKYAALNKYNDLMKSFGFIGGILHFFPLLFVLPIVVFVDAVILNSIEFWTGSNPLAMKAGEREVQIVNKDGVNHEIVATKNRFDVTVLDGENAGKHASLIFNDNTLIWSVENGTEKMEIAQIDSNDLSKMRILVPGLEGKIVDSKM